MGINRHSSSITGSRNLFRGQSSLQHLYRLNILVMTMSSLVLRRTHWQYRFLTLRKILQCCPWSFLPRSWHRPRFLALLLNVFFQSCVLENCVSLLAKIYKSYKAQFLNRTGADNNPHDHQCMTFLCDITYTLYTNPLPCLNRVVNTMIEILSLN